MSDGSIDLGGDENPEAPPSPEESPQHQREGAREAIALWLLAILSGILVALFSLLGGRVISAAEVRDLGAVLIAPVVGLLGSVIGFYFGEKAGSSK